MKCPSIFAVVIECLCAGCWVVRSLKHFFTELFCPILHVRSEMTEAATRGVCSMKKGVPKNFAKFTGKDLFQSLFLIKLQASGLQSFYKRDSGTSFSCELCKN